MPLTSPGGWGAINPVMRVTTVIIVTLGTLSWGETIVGSSRSDSDGLHSDDSEQTVVLQIGNVNQPDNCSEFLNDLEELLRKTSEYATKLNSASALKEYQVVVPRAWDWSLCQGQRRQSSYVRPAREADILVGESHPQFGSHPWTLSSRGCGERGLLINLPISFLVSTSLDFDVRGQILAREWTKYDCGVFSEQGFKDDPLYPSHYQVGNSSTSNQGCPHNNKTFWQFCNSDEDYDRSSPTKQNIQCLGRSANEVIASSCDKRRKIAPSDNLNNFNERHSRNFVTLPSVDQPNFVTISPENKLRRNPKFEAQPSSVDHQIVRQILPQDGDDSSVSSSQQGSRPKSDQKTRTKRQSSLPAPVSLSQSSDDIEEDGVRFSYRLASSTKYNILVDQTSNMGINMRWTNVKRALFRFINLVPVGSRLNIHSVGESVKEVLPTTTVTEANRDGLFGRIPRRVTEDTRPCVGCAVSKVLKDLGPNEVVILITGTGERMTNIEEMSREVEARRLPVYIISYPPTLDTSYTGLARWGGVYSVVENSHNIQPLIHLQEIFASIVTTIEHEMVEKIHETHYNSLGFAGTFTFEKEQTSELLITLNVPDEEKVELFEVKDPSGKKRIFSKFEDGMVYFKFSGQLPPGIWSYHAKLYHDSLYPDTRMVVDVVTKSETNTGIIAQLFTSLQHDQGTVTADVESEPVTVFAKVMRGGLPVLGASAEAEVYLPGEDLGQSLGDGLVHKIILRDDGLGYPDLTANDGLYSAYIPSYAASPGYYSTRLRVGDNHGRASVPKGQTRDQDHQPGPECCGSSIDFGNNTSPTGSFTRLTTGPAFYVARGFSPTRDISPPNRISDLSLQSQEEEQLSIRLAWTAPGGDFDEGKAHKYEIRCHTVLGMLGEENFESKGILVHADNLPVPEARGTRQFVLASVPWTNELFFYAIVAVDEKGNRGQISNIVSVYIHELTTTTTTTTEPASTLDPYLILKYLKDKNLSAESLDEEQFLRNISENLELELERSSGEVYVAVGIVAGVVVMVVILLASIVMVTRRKRSQRGERGGGSKSPSSNTSQDDASSTQRLEGVTGSKLTKVSKVSPDGSSKVLLSWLESLPKSDTESLEHGPPSPGPGSHNNSIDSNINTINRRNQTLTRTNPYRHKMLTNGSFVSLKDIPGGSEEGSTRLTTSTGTDDSNGSDTSSGSGGPYNNIGLTSKSIRESSALVLAAQAGPGAANIKRSNTSAAQLSSITADQSNNQRLRSHGTGYYSFRDYSPVYGTATLGRGQRAYGNGTNLSVLSEDPHHHSIRSNRRTKRTESFV